MTHAGERKTVAVVGSPVDVVKQSTAIKLVSQWARSGESRYVCFCNVHSLITAHGSGEFSQVLRSSDLNLPDGAPVAWLMRKLGNTGQSRMAGPDFMLAYCADAQQREERHFLYGSTEHVLECLVGALKDQFPLLDIVGAYSPPFRALSALEDEEVVKRINDSGAHVIWVSLGCPKQERWMHAHRGRIKGVMLGVGAAFDYHSGQLARAPVWMRKAGLEWAYRLFQEPGRLWKRYLISNAQFMCLAVKALVGKRKNIK